MPAPPIDPAARPRRLSSAAMKAWRARMGLTQAQAADLTGVSRRSWNAWERLPLASPRWLGLVLSAVERGIEPVREPDA